MKGKQKLFFLLIFAFLLNISYSKELMGSLPQNAKEVAKGNNQFSLDLYSNISKKEKGNIFFSPFSIYSAFVMVYEGADGKTAEEIGSVFNFQKESKERWRNWELILNDINKKSKEYELFTANALWIQEGFKTLPEYKRVIEEYYKGTVSTLDFAGKTDKARMEINRWVEEKTNKKIRNLFYPGSLNQLTKLVLTNAIYFKGEWFKQFDKNETRDEDFRVSKEKIVKVLMMRIEGQNARFNYAEMEDLQILEMDYKGNELSMIVLLPKKDIEKLEKSLTEENLRNWLKRLREERVDVFFPKLKLNKKYILNENIKEMGATSAFTPGEANFSRIDGTKRLFIQIAVHQAFLEVNEEGTTAGGATGIGIGITAVPVKKVFRADHPFIFIIQEKENGNILFMGRVYDPTE
jgi:serpin B